MADPENIGLAIEIMVLCMTDHVLMSEVHVYPINNYLGINSR